MRIAYVTSEYVTEKSFDGGLSNYLYRLSKALVRFGHEPIIFVSAEYEEKFTYEGIEVYRIKIFNKWINLFNKLTRHLLSGTISRIWVGWKLNKAVMSIHKEKKIDIIQHANYLATGFFRPKNIITVIRISSFESLWNQAYEIRVTVDTKISENLELASLKKADYLFGPSKKLAMKVEAATERKVSVIKTPIYIETEDFDLLPYNDLLKGKKYLLFFGGIGLLKGVKTIADMLNRFLAKYPDFFFIFIGRDYYYKNELMMEYVWTKAGSMRGRVLYLGRLRHNQLYPIVQNACIVILPSRIDNSPNTCLEAMALRKIVIGTKNTSMDELIIDGYNGFLSEVDNSHDLLNKIEIVLSLDDEIAKSISHNAYIKSLEYSPDIVVPELINHYDNIANRI